MPLDEKKNPWRTVASKEVYDNSWINVREDTVVQPDGEPGIYGVVHFKNIAIGILAIEGEFIYLVGQYRYPLNKYSWEIPEGGEAHLSNSVTDEHAIWFLATGLSEGKRNPEGTEQLKVCRVLFHEALEMVFRGDITDALSSLAIMRYQLLNGIETAHPD